MQRMWAASAQPLLSDVNAVNLLLSRGGAVGTAAAWGPSNTYSHALERTTPQALLSLLDSAISAKNIPLALVMMGTLLKEFNSFPNAVADALFRLFDATNAVSLRADDDEGEEDHGARSRALTMTKTMEFLVDAARSPQQQIAIAYGLLERFVQARRWDEAQELVETLKSRDLYSNDSRLFYYIGVMDLGRWRDSVLLGIDKQALPSSASTSSIAADRGAGAGHKKPASSSSSTANSKGGNVAAAANASRKTKGPAKRKDRYEEEEDDFDDDDDDEEEEDDDNSNHDDLEALLFGIPPAYSAASAAPARKTGAEKKQGRRKSSSSEDNGHEEEEDEDEDDDRALEDDNSFASLASPSASSSSSSPSSAPARKRKRSSLSDSSSPSTASAAARGQASGPDDNEEDNDDSSSQGAVRHPPRAAIAKAVGEMTAPQRALLDSARSNFARVIELARGGAGLPASFSLPLAALLGEQDENEGEDDGDRKKKRGRPKGAKDKKKRQKPRRKKKKGLGSDSDDDSEEEDDDESETATSLAATLASVVPLLPSSSSAGSCSYGEVFKASTSSAAAEEEEEEIAAASCGVAEEALQSRLAIKAAITGCGLLPLGSVVNDEEEEGEGSEKARATLQQRCFPLIIGASGKPKSKKELKAEKKLHRRLARVLDLFFSSAEAAAVPSAPALQLSASSAAAAEDESKKKTKKGKDNKNSSALVTGKRRGKKAAALAALDEDRYYRHYPYRKKPRWRLETALEETARNLIFSVATTAFGASSTPSVLSFSSFSACHMASSLAKLMVLERVLARAGSGQKGAKSKGSDDRRLSAAAEALLPVLQHGNPFLFRCFSFLRQIERRLAAHDEVSGAVATTQPPLEDDCVARACSLAPSFLASRLPLAFKGLVAASSRLACFTQDTSEVAGEAAENEEEEPEGEEEQAAPAPSVVFSILPPLPAEDTAKQSSKEGKKMRKGKKKPVAAAPLPLPLPRPAVLDLAAFQALGIRKNFKGLLKRGQASSGGPSALLQKAIKQKHEGKKHQEGAEEDDEDEGAHLPFSLSAPSFGDLFRLFRSSSLLAAGTHSIQLPPFRSLVASLEANVAAFDAASGTGDSGASIAGSFAAAGITAFGFALPKRAIKHLRKAAGEVELPDVASLSSSSKTKTKNQGTLSGQKRSREEKGKGKHLLPPLISSWQPRPSSLLQLLVTAPPSPVSLLAYLVQLTALCALNGQSSSVVVEKLGREDSDDDEEGAKDGHGTLAVALRSSSPAMAMRAVRLLLHVANQHLGLGCSLLSALLVSRTEGSAAAEAEAGAVSSLLFEEIEKPLLSLPLPTEWLLKASREGAFSVLATTLTVGDGLKGKEQAVKAALSDSAALPLAVAASAATLGLRTPSALSRASAELARVLAKSHKEEGNSSGDEDDDSRSSSSGSVAPSLLASSLPALVHGTELLQQASRPTNTKKEGERPLFALTPEEHVALARLAVLLMLKELVA